MQDTAGILPRQALAALNQQGAIAAERPFDADQIQPASLDLRLGTVAHRIRASFLPGPEVSVADKLAEVTLHTIDLSQGAVLETGCVYVVPLQERLALPSAVAASTNPKSSTGRLDVFTRVIADRAGAFDRVPAGYSGPLYAEISPRTFPVLVRTGSRLSQIRFRRGSTTLSDAELTELHRNEPLVAPGNAAIDSGLQLSIDLESELESAIVGYRGKRHTGVIDVDRKDGYDIADFWDPVTVRPGRGLILDPNEFYILVSREAVQVPPGYAAEMVPFDPLVGEFRVHYAGFFDPGFGHGAAGSGARAVLEVRSHEVPFILDHGQVVGRLVYERMAELPDTLYGTGLGSNYQAQRLKLSKHFRAV
ncbi:2'-deoxycytidine 5'-triphosphate deaminase [Amorphus sp. 3PC139-8]|uniref:2'-deoxycytidine 5'-triphosphate deaminase n=1 Tax=Amorphus sp. 3PC139-8 TaxID=2735676 RepID=UPI00345D9FF9